MKKVVRKNENRPILFQFKKSIIGIEVSVSMTMFLSEYRYSGGRAFFGQVSWIFFANIVDIFCRYRLQPCHVFGLLQKVINASQCI